MILDYVTLKIIWWCIMGLLMAAFAISGGMDIGSNILLLIVGKSETERRLILNAVGPTWEGNQVWLVTFGAALFAVWPAVYATAFSGLYLALFIVVLMLILRPPGFDYRGKINSQRWRAMWDLSLFSGGVVLALVFGVAVGNLFVGLPFTFDESLRVIYSGGLFDLFTPAPILFGLVSVCILTLQGALFLQNKLDGDLVVAKLKSIILLLGLIFTVSFILAGIYVCMYLPGYYITTIPDLNSSFSALQKTVVLSQQGWLANYSDYPALWILPVLSVIYVLKAVLCSRMNKPKLGLFINSLAIVGIIATAATALFPFILVSSINPNMSLTIWDAASSYNTLAFTFAAVLILLPIVLLYTAWVYRVMRGKVKLQQDSY